MREDEKKLKSSIKTLTEKEETSTKNLEKLERKSKNAQGILDTLDETKGNLAAYSLSIGDFEAVKNFLKEIGRLGGDPAKAVEILEEDSSLDDNIKKKTRELDELSRCLKEEIETCTEKTRELKETRERVSKLAIKESKAVQRLEELKKDEVQQKGRLKALGTSVAQMLGVKADVIEMNKAINATAEKLQNLEIAVGKEEVVLEDKQLEISKLEEKRQGLKLEVAGILKIKDYATEHKTAIAGLEQKKGALEKECAEKSAKIALGETITNFLTRMPTSDFNKFHAVVESVKRAREDKSSPLGPLVPRIGEGIRMKALEALNGDLIHKKWHEAVVKKKEEYRLKSISQEEELKIKDGELASVRKQNEFLEKLKVYVEGEQRSLKDLENWTIYVFNKEIERRVNERYDSGAARAKGAIDWLVEKVAKKTQSS